ncbi:hypothetical protein BDW68DRAFT_178518 [Aspergillus falconensis]
MVLPMLIALPAKSTYSLSSAASASWSVHNRRIQPGQYSTLKQTYILLHERESTIVRPELRIPDTAIVATGFICQVSNSQAAPSVPTNAAPTEAPTAAPIVVSPFLKLDDLIFGLAPEVSRFPPSPCLALAESGAALSSTISTETQVAVSAVSVTLIVLVFGLTTSVLTSNPTTTSSLRSQQQARRRLHIITCQYASLSPSA